MDPSALQEIGKQVPSLVVLFLALQIFVSYVRGRDAAGEDRDKRNSANDEKRSEVMGKLASAFEANTQILNKAVDVLARFATAIERGKS